MKKAAIFLANGFEEVEALTAVDLLRRGGVEVEMISIQNWRVTGRSGIAVEADSLFTGKEEADCYLLPGGMPGTKFLQEQQTLGALLQEKVAQGKIIGAICAAPIVLGYLGLLEGKPACCYPGMEEGLTGAKVSKAPVCVAENIITSRGVGTAIPFALTVLAALQGEEVAKEVAESIVAQWPGIERP